MKIKLYDLLETLDKGQDFHLFIDQKHIGRYYPDDMGIEPYLPYYVNTILVEDEVLEIYLIAK